MLKTNSVLLSLFLVLFVGHQAGRAQKPVHEGVTLYKARKFSEAASLLGRAVKQKEHKTDGQLWNYLGLSYVEISNDKKAIKAFQTAAKLDPANATYLVNHGYLLLMNRQINKAQSQIERALKLDPNNYQGIYIRGVSNFWEGKLELTMADAERIIILDPANEQGYILKSDVLIAQLGRRVSAGATVKDEIDYLKQALDILVLGNSLVKDSKRMTIAKEVEAKSAFYEYFSRPKPDPLTENPGPEPGVTPLKVLTKQKAAYTDRARVANIQGTITIATLFGASGKIEQVMILKGLGYGLDEQALRALRQITFEPQKKDGKPVSTVRPVTFSFNIH